MKRRYHNTRRRAWTEADVAQLVALSDSGLGQRAIANKMNRTISSVEGKLRLVRLGPTLGPGMSRYEAPEAIDSDCAKHLDGISDANHGRGFPAVTDALLERLVVFERAPRNSEFWRNR